MTDVWHTELMVIRKRADEIKDKLDGLRQSTEVCEGAFQKEAAILHDAARSTEFVIACVEELGKRAPAH